MNTYPLSETVSVFITNAVLLTVYSLYIMAYLHSAYSNIPFIYKLTGIPLVFTLIIVTTAGYLMMHFRSISYDEMNMAVINNIDADKLSKPGKKPYTVVAKLNRGGNFYEVVYNVEGFENRKIAEPIWPYTPNGMQIKTETGSVSKTGVQLYKRYFLHYDKENFLLYHADIDGSIYAFAFPYIEHLEYMDRTGEVIIVIMLVSMMILVTALPLLNYFGIIAPLHMLLKEQTQNEETTVDNELAQISNLLKSRRKTRKKESKELSVAVRKKLDVTIDYIHENYRENLSRDGLAAAADFDTDYLSRLFKIYTGEKIGDYINNLRIEDACTLLVQTDKSIIDISMEVGFESLRTFNRVFTKFTGSTPSQFRRKR